MFGSNLFDRFVDNNWALAAGALVVAVAWIVGTRCFGDRSVVRLFPRTAAVAELIVVPLAVIVFGGLAHILLRYLGFSGFDDELRTLTIFCIYLTVAWTFARIVEVFFLSKVADGVATSLPGLQLSLLYGGFLLIGLFVFLVVNDYSITGFYVSTGAAAALVGFAMQRTLGDLFSGIALSIERPFRLGDWIELDDGTIGQVIEINWRATRALSEQSSKYFRRASDGPA